jgi:putative exosortase-associated protein (TIGR04073 family)
MRQTIFNLLGCASLAFVITGCAGPEQKLGRGLTNLMEPLRGGEMSRSIEQATLFESPDMGYTTGQVRGARRTFARTMLGVYEVATFPIPNTHRYEPICTGALKATPVYPDGYKPGWVSGDNNLSTDSHLGIFDSGDVAPMFPGSRFRIFDN